MHTDTLLEQKQIQIERISRAVNEEGIHRSDAMNSLSNALLNNAEKPLHLKEDLFFDYSSDKGFTSPTYRGQLLSELPDSMKVEFYTDVSLALMSTYQKRIGSVNLSETDKALFDSAMVSFLNRNQKAIKEFSNVDNHNSGAKDVYFDDAVQKLTSALSYDVRHTLSQHEDVLALLEEKDFSGLNERVRVKEMVQKMKDFEGNAPQDVMEHIILEGVNDILSERNMNDNHTHNKKLVSLCTSIADTWKMLEQDTFTQSDFIELANGIDEDSKKLVDNYCGTLEMKRRDNQKIKEQEMQHTPTSSISEKKNSQNSKTNGSRSRRI